MSNPETRKEIQKLKGMKKELNKRLEKIKDSDPETYNRIKSRYTK